MSIYKTMAKWISDPAHSEVEFKVKHMMLTYVKGKIENFSVEAETSGDSSDVFKATKASFMGEISSIDTGNEQRDSHLRTADFFNMEENPKIIFIAKKYEGDTIEGDLSMAGITKPVKLNVEFTGIGKDPWGNTRAGFSVSGKINRKDWGIKWNTPLEGGGFLVGDEVTINADIQLVKQN